jgi:hypothetical protein
LVKDKRPSTALALLQKKLRNLTPSPFTAMEAKVTDRLWDIEGIVKLLD